MAEKPRREAVTAQSSVILKFFMGEKAGKYRTPKDIQNELSEFFRDEEGKVNKGELKMYDLLVLERNESKKMIAKIARGAQNAVPAIEEAVSQCKEKIADAANSIWKTLKDKAPNITQKSEAIARAVGGAFNAVGDLAGDVAKAVGAKIPQPVKDFAKACRKTGSDFIRDAGFIGRGVAAVMSAGIGNAAGLAAKAIGEKLKSAGARIERSGEGAQPIGKAVRDAWYNKGKNTGRQQ